MANVTWDDSGEPPIVRQRVANVHQETRRALPLSVVRAIDTKCLNYRLAMSSPAAAAASLQGGACQAATLEAAWEGHVDASPMAAAIDKPALKRLGLDLLQEVGELEATPVEA